MIRIAFAVVFLTLSINECVANTPALQGALHLNGIPTAGGRASVDGKRFVMMLQGKDKQPPTLQIVDTSDVSHPRLMGSLPVAYGTWALSDDGNTVLLALQTERELFNKEINREVVAIDLRDAKNPRELWRRKIVARKLILSNGANAFAYSQSRPAKPGEWEKWKTTVEYVQRDRPSVTIDDPQYSAGNLHFSPHGDFLVDVRLSEELYEWDLRFKEPKQFQQGSTGFQRYGCISAVLNDGHVIVRDTRFPRLGIYEANPSIPRISTLSYDNTGADYGVYCGSLNPNSTDDTYIYPDGHGRLRQLNFHNVKTPSMGMLWQLPSDIYPQAIAGNILFSVTGNNEPELRLYRLDVIHAEAIDWQAMAKAHASIMDEYNAAVKAKKPIPYFDATSRFEKAGILLAVDAPLENISPQKAAAILNDYGFLAIKKRGSADLIEHILRRSIELDPRRALAHLNLADFLRDQLPVYAASSRDATDLRREIEEHYRTYLALGGEPTDSINAFLKGDKILEAQNGGVCAASAAYANAGRLGELVSSSGLNVPFNGKKIDLAFTTEGTAHVPTLYAFESATDFPLKEGEMPQVPPGTENAWGGDELGLMTYRHQSHILFYRDLQHPTSSASLSDSSTCSFSTSTVEKIGPNATERDLCAKLQKGDGPTPYVFDGESQMDREDVSETWGESEISGTHVLDIANNHKSVNVAELEMTSGAGAGCDETFYEVVNADATAFMSGAMRDLLMHLQYAMPANRYPILPCGNKPSFFSYKDRLYFETKPVSWPPLDKWHQYHRVTTVIDGRVREVCDFQFETTVKGMQGSSAE